MKQRRTRQLTAIYDVLAAAHDHPTAEQVFDRVRSKIPNVSLGTVYRNLDKLRAIGQLRLLRWRDGVAHFDATTDEHDHFLCDSCGQAYDLEVRSPVLPRPDVLPAGFVIQSQATTYYGWCPNCAELASPAGGRADRSESDVSRH